MVHIAEELIKDGHVKLNGQIVRRVATNVNPEKDNIAVNGKIISFPQLLLITKQYHIVDR